MTQFQCGYGLQLLNRWTLFSALWIGAVCAVALGPNCRSDEKSAAYIRAINETRADLDAGKTTEARTRLEATDESHRRFEFDYLQARLQHAPAEGGAAPELILKVAKPEVETRYGVLNPVNRQMVFICRDGGLRIHDLQLPEAEPRVEKHPQGSSIWTGTFSHDGKSFFSGHENGEVLIWDAADWKLLKTVSLEAAAPVRELAAAPDGSAFVAESNTGLELWSLSEEQPKKVANVGERYNFGEGLSFSPTGDLLATGGMFDIILHDAKTGKQIRSMRHASYTMGLEFSPDGKRIASAPRGNVNKFLAVFDIDKDQPLFNAGPFDNYVVGLAFTPDGNRIAGTGCEKQLRLFDAATGEVVLAFKREECGSEPTFTHDGRLLGWSEPSGYLFIDLGKLPEADSEK